MQTRAPRPWSARPRAPTPSDRASAARPDLLADAHQPADVAIRSSSGWAHGAHVDGRKIVYCHTPARWLYQPERYLGQAGGTARVGRAILHRPLERWDRRAAASADLYLANSTWIANEIKRIYGIGADVLHPPLTVDVSGEQDAYPGIEPGFVLCVRAFRPARPSTRSSTLSPEPTGRRLVVAGWPWPRRGRTARTRRANVTIAGSEITDAQLRWLYANCTGLVAASYEDFGLTPIEAAAFGKPTAAASPGSADSSTRSARARPAFSSTGRRPAAIRDRDRESSPSRSWDEPSYACARRNVLRGKLCETPFRRSR